jgi:uncharacterized cupin superfamily protein
MYIVQHLHPTACGERALSAAGPAHGLAGFEVWLGTLAPGEHGALSRHDGELVVLAMSGCGKLVVDGGPQRFSAPCTLLIPRSLSYEIVNNGTVPLRLVSVFTVAPVPSPRDAPPASAPSCT